MTGAPIPPRVAAFARWIARRDRAGADRAAPAPVPEAIIAAARAARAAQLALLDGGVAAVGSRIEVLAASDTGPPGLPQALLTARGFRIALSYDEAEDGTGRSLCVLVQAPPEFAARVNGAEVFLRSGDRRFPIGHFDADGKALGTLPVGFEISPADLAAGRVLLEEPDVPDGA
jgi:hypothetical protein